MAGRRWLTPAEVAERTGFNIRTLANWRCKREGPPFTGRGPGVRYPEDGLEAWMDSRAIATR